jgi:protein involved in polysaccharide export with SLBB domain
VIKAAISKSFSNFQINVSPGQIKAIRVYVVGQANKPGVYTISSLSSLITAMFVTGGPNASGSMRNIQLKRAGKVIATVDMYAFIAKGDKAQDVKLLEGDTIVIPPVYGHVAIVGKIDAPAIYELKNASETIESLLSLTGGLPPVADPLMATLERLDPKQKPSRFYVDITLDQQGQQQSLVNGDLLTVLPISTSVPIAKRNIYVRIEGEVAKPGLYQVKPGQTTQDLIKLAGGPTKEAYLFGTAFYRESTRVQQVEAFDKVLKRVEASLKSQSLTMASQVGVGDAAVLAMKNQAAVAAGQAQLARLKSIKPEGRITLNLEPGINQVSMLPSLTLEPNDRLVIPAKSQFVQIYGAVNVESALMYQPGDTVSDYLRVAGLQKEADRDGIFVARPDGSVLMHGGFFSGIQSAELYPGDVVIVPEKFDRETGYSVFMRGLKDWTQVLGQLGLAAAAIKVLK